MALILSQGFLHVRAGVAGKEWLIVCLLASVSGPEPAVSKLNPGCVAGPLRRVISPSHLLTAGLTSRNFTDPTLPAHVQTHSFTFSLQLLLGLSVQTFMPQLFYFFLLLIYPFPPCYPSHYSLPLHFHQGLGCL